MLYEVITHNVRQDEAANRGQMRANFVRGRGDMMGVAGDLNDNATVPAPVDSYWPNDFGLYCMAGNVNEWVQDVYRPLTFEDVDEFNPYRGNVFQKLATDEEGNVAEKDSLGRLKYVEISTDEAINRWNYKKADYRNYMDGDYESSISDAGGDWNSGSASQERGSNRMYKKDIGDESSLITDQSRVYVITSYSIHYTKLYELPTPPAQVESSRHGGRIPLRRRTASSPLFF